MADNHADEQLLETYAQRQDPHAFRLLVDRYSGMVFGTARRVTADAALAEDIAQEVFLELARQAAAIHGSLGAWLHRVAYNRALDANRRRSTRRRHEAEAVDYKHRLAGTSGWEELGPIIDAAIEALPEDQRQPLVQHYLLGQTQEQIAVELGVNPTTVSRRIQRGLDKVRARMRKEGVIASAATLAGLLGQASAEAAPLTVTANLSKIGLAGIGGAGAGTSLTAVGAGTVASLVAAALLMLCAGVGIAAWSTSAPSAAAVNATPPTGAASAVGAAMHPRVGPVVGYFEGQPIYAGHLLLPLGWPDAPPPQLSDAATALPVLAVAAEDELLRRVVAQQAANALTPAQWQDHQAQRDRWRAALVQSHGQGDARRADQALQHATGWSLDATVRRQAEDALALRYLAQQSPDLAAEPSALESPIRGAADDRTPSSRQPVLAQLRGAALAPLRARFTEGALPLASFTPPATMAEETWRWLAGDPAAAPPPLELLSEIILLSDAAWQAAQLPLAEPAGDVRFGNLPLPTAWLEPAEVQRLTDLADADSLSGRSRQRSVAIASRALASMQWQPAPGHPTVQVGGMLRQAAPGVAPAVRLVIRVGQRDPQVVSIDRTSANRPLLLDLGELPPGEAGGEHLLVIARFAPAAPSAPQP